jgi:hypothetical protein
VTWTVGPAATAAAVNTRVMTAESARALRIEGSMPHPDPR